MQNHTNDIDTAVSFLKETISNRLKHFFQKEAGNNFFYPAANLDGGNSPLQQFARNHRLNEDEFTILLLGLMPHVRPNLLDAVIQEYLASGGDFPEIGGIKGGNHRGTLPTGETALFIIAGNDTAKRLAGMEYFLQDHFFAKENILALEPVKDGEPFFSGKIILQQDYLDLFTIGRISKPAFSPDFPAKLVTTKMEWNDLVITAKTNQQINDIKIWLQHNGTFMNDWGMDKRVKHGFRALFYGPSGTGKTFAATLLGKQFQRDVYRIDLSQIVSKYIGETEKNLEKVFNKAENKNWILFFDEADALFGKRSNVQSAHDKYANQEVSYLLQRVEDFPGLIILASNFKSNIDQAFIRRFNTIIHFPMPGPTERLEIWKTAMPSKALLAADSDLPALAAKYELSGSAIVSIIHYASLQTICRNSQTIEKHDLIEGIKREFEKEERVFT